MVYGEQQKKEIETIRKRNISMKLSNADCERISILCAKNGITVAELLENFIGDLVDGTYSNGSDERSLAQDYFDRCGFGAFSEDNSLLKWLLNNDYDVHINLLMPLDEVEDLEKEIKYLQQNPEEAEPGEIEGLRGNIELLSEELEEIKANYMAEHGSSDWKNQVEEVRVWWNRLEHWINE